MHSVFNRSNEVIETLRDYIDRKLTIYDSPKYTYMVINKKIQAIFLLSLATQMNGLNSIQLIITRI